LFLFLSNSFSEIRPFSLREASFSILDAASKPSWGDTAALLFSIRPSASYQLGMIQSGVIG
jgi:hypothetical protein